MRRGVLTGLIGLAFMVGAAAAKDAAISDFSGQWVGQVSVETAGETDFPTSVREAGLLLTPDDNGGFTIEWSTVKREKGDPQRPDESVADVEIPFVPAAGPGRWSAVGGNPAKGEAIWFARLEEATLTIVGFALLENGQAELQTYQRTLEGESLGLSYTRVVDGAVVRRASGVLTKFAP